MSVKQRSSGRLVRATFAAIVLVAVAPFISVLISAVIAGVLGCELDEGSLHPCPFMGVDLGEMLYVMFVLGWFGLLTLPLGAVALWVWQMIRP
jgi:hypothetical protein